MPAEPGAWLGLIFLSDLMGMLLNDETTNGTLAAAEMVKAPLGVTEKNPEHHSNRLLTAMWTVALQGTVKAQVGWIESSRVLDGTQGNLLK